MSFKDEYLDWLVDNDICKGDEKMARLDYRSCDLGKPVKDINDRKEKKNG